MFPGGVAAKGVAGLIKSDVVLEDDGEHILRYRNNAAVIAVSNRNWAAPIALAGNTPIAESIVDPPLANSRLFHPRRYFPLGVGNVQTVEKIGIDEHGLGLVLLDESLFADCKRLRVGSRGCYDGNNRQIVASGKLQIALIMSRAAENCPFAIGHEHEISGIDRQANIASERVARIELQKHAFLFCALDC